MDKRLNVKRLEVAIAENKLNSIQGIDTEAHAFLTMLTLTKNSPKYDMSAGAPFPAIVKKMKTGGLAIFNSVTAKHEVLPEGYYKEPTPITGDFEYKGHVYERNPVHYLYTLKK